VGVFSLFVEIASPRIIRILEYRVTRRFEKGVEVSLHNVNSEDHFSILVVVDKARTR